jgi:hypothetical protein
MTITLADDLRRIVGGPVVEVKPAMSPPNRTDHHVIIDGELAGLVSEYHDDQVMRFCVAVTDVGVVGWHVELADAVAVVRAIHTAKAGA